MSSKYNLLFLILDFFFKKKLIYIILNEMIFFNLNVKIINGNIKRLLILSVIRFLLYINVSKFICCML